jgi:uncharacterized phage protein (TIGR02218 family)
MPRYIPIALAEHIHSGATTMCTLVKVTPVQPGFIEFGITTLDRDVIYDDGTGGGPLLYSSPIGTEPSSLTASADLTVAGGETKQLMPLFDTPVSEADLAAGAYDYAKFIAYSVNYNDLTSGSHIIIQSGTLGRNTITESGLSWTSELRGLTQPLKQSITEKWSIACRAIFGSQEPSAGNRFPCMFDISTLWQDGTVLSVGVDTTQEFTCGTEVAPDFGGAPGAVEWLTGANVGRTDESETFFAIVDPPGHTIGLTFGAMFPIQVGDTFRFRDDCPHTPAACRARNNFPNYRGEPSIPVSDAGAIAIGNVNSSKVNG